MPSPSRDVLGALVDLLADRVAENLSARAAADDIRAARLLQHGVIP